VPTCPYIGLLVDSTTIEICWLGEPFEVKAYYDVKNAIYGIKEVTVLATAPHYTLHLSFHLGSEHDFAIHKAEYHTYETYLAKTP